MEAIVKPSFGRLVEDWETIEEGDAILGKRVWVLGDTRVVDAR